MNQKMPSSAHDSTVTNLLSRCHYRHIDRCKRDILSALHHYAGLQPKKEPFTFNDGRSKDLVCLRGTIPVHYRGSMYNIPVGLWILDTHPMHAPLCFVMPTPDMEIRVSSHVDGSGKIYLPYLHDWDSVSSDILGVIQMCIITFGEQPPVFARAPNPVQPPVMPAIPVPSYYPPVSSSYQQPPAYPPASAAAYPPANTITQEHLLASIKSAVEDKVRRHLKDEFATKQVEMASLTKTRDDLNGGKCQLERSLRQMERESDQLDQATVELLREEEDLKKVMKRAQDLGDDDKMGGVQPDEAVGPQTPLFKQLVKAHAEEAAVHDVIYYLGKAQNKGIIDCDVYLKHVRNLSRKQFHLRATMIECRKKAGLPL